MMLESQSAFVRGFIDDTRRRRAVCPASSSSQSAFVRGFIDDRAPIFTRSPRLRSLNPRSCAASSMTASSASSPKTTAPTSQSAFVRGFIDDHDPRRNGQANYRRLNPRSCAASSMTHGGAAVRQERCIVSIRVRARLHR